MKGAGFAAIPIILTQDNDAWQIRGEHVDYFQDNEHKYSIYDVTNDNFKDKCKKDADYLFDEIKKLPQLTKDILLTRLVDEL